MEAILLEDNDIHYAYSRIHYFFDVFGMSHALQYTESTLKAATTNKIWNDEDPSGLLFFMEKLDILCSATFAIYYSNAERKEAVLDEPEDGQPNLLIAENFCDTYYKSSVWNNFPRNLTARQYHNPYKAIKRFCNCMSALEWKHFFKELTDNALTKHPDEEIFFSFNLLTIRLRLLQLIEACHLIDVRTNKKRQGSTGESNTENSDER